MVRAPRRLITRGALACLLSGAVAVAAACSGNPTSPPAGTPILLPAGAEALIGPWTSTITKEDLNAAGLTDPGLQNENSGRFVLTLGPDGTWTQVQESLDGSPIRTPVFRGNFVVAGEDLVLTTTFPAEYADAGIRYDWAIEDQALRLDVLNPPDDILPLVFETHPWARVP
jgi:hypothetical protein